MATSANRRRSTNAPAGKRTAWWHAAEEDCPHCDQAYAGGAEAHCAECDAVICPLCVQSSNSGVLCPRCAAGTAD